MVSVNGAVNSKIKLEIGYENIFYLDDHIAWNRFAFFYSTRQHIDSMHSFCGHMNGVRIKFKVEVYTQIFHFTILTLFIYVEFDIQLLLTAT